MFGAGGAPGQMSNQQSADDEGLVRVHFDVVYFWVAGHWGVRREDARLSPRSAAAAPPHRVYVSRWRAARNPPRIQVRDGRSVDHAHLSDGRMRSMIFCRTSGSFCSTSRMEVYSSTGR